MLQREAWHALASGLSEQKKRKGRTCRTAFPVAPSSLRRDSGVGREPAHDRVRNRGEETALANAYFAIDFGWLPDVRALVTPEPLLMSAGETAALFFLLADFFAFFIFIVFLPGAVVCAAAFGSVPEVRAFG